MSHTIKILYVQHAGALGGSSMSLLYTMQGMRDLGHICTVALARPSRDLLQLYQEDGFETIPCPGLALWDHSAGAPRPLIDPRTWSMYTNIAVGWRRTERRIMTLVDSVRPDLVHLNSMVFSVTADALIRQHVPFVWHVREPPPDQGFRTNMIRQIMLRSPALIYISDFDRQQWVKGAKGVVVHNFLDLERFRPTLDASPVRANHNVPDGAKVILYLGGVSTIKGFFVLLDALSILRNRGIDFVCMMPGTDVGPLLSIQGKVAAKLLPLVGRGTPKQIARRRIAERGLEPYLRALPFSTDIPLFFAASDVVVFPSIRPHFARPVIESIAMEKPAIGSNLGGVRELIDLHPLGTIVPPDDPVKLAAAIETSFNYQNRPDNLQGLFSIAKRRFDRSEGVAAINVLYHNLLGLRYGSD